VDYSSRVASKEAKRIEEPGVILAVSCCFLLVADLARFMISTPNILRGALIGLLAAVACFTAFALESDRTIAQFAHAAWGPNDGAPSSITALAQTADGYLWLGSHDGLYRFDGVVFERYQPQSGDPLPVRIVSSLLALPNGDLWIGFYAGGVSLLRNGNATNYGTRDGLPGGNVRGLAQDREGTVWAGTNSGLAQLDGNRWRQVGKDWNFPGSTSRTVFVDCQGTLWVSTEDTLVFLPAGAKKFRPTGIRLGQVLKIASSANGKLWMAETTRSVRPIPLSDKRLPLDETEVRVGSMSILFDNDGGLWIATLGDGLRRSAAPELLKGEIKEQSAAVESFTSRDGLSDDYVRCILQDREGNIWAGTNSGLDRFRKTNLVRVVFPADINIKGLNYAVMVAGNAGDVLIGGLRYVVRFHEGHIDNKDAHRLLSGQAEYAYRDSSAVVWWLCIGGIYRDQAGRYTGIGLPRSFPKTYNELAVAATADGNGAHWLAARIEGLFYWKKGRWQQVASTPEFATLTPTTAFTDWMGHAWIGYAEGTIVIVDQANIQKVFPAAASLVDGVKAISGRGRHIWVGGDSGLAFFDGNRFRRIVPDDTERFDLVAGVEEASDGSLWLAENRGVIRIPASEVQHALENPSYRVKYRIFDSFDGLSGKFSGAATNHREIQGTDGKLWFSTSGSLVWVDPANISTNALPPPVSIRSVKANRIQLDPLANLVLPPRTTNLQISYTALSLSVPEKVRFRYRLEGADKDWQDAGTRREAFYTRLGPGKYHFQVMACNNDGVWNETGTSLNFTIAPAWFQTIWFLTFCAMAFLLLLWSLYQLRLNQLKHQFSRALEVRVDERTRIARELHDTLLQSFQGITLHFQRARNLLPDRTAEAIQTLDTALDGAEEAIVEGRDAIHDLRSSTTAAKTLAEEIKALGEELVTKGANPKDPVEFRLVVEGSARPMRPNLYIEVFRITREALRNAFSHSQGHLIETEMAYTGKGFRLRIRDDGKGINLDERVRAERSGHWGLKGMQERAERLGGELEVWSEPGAGTEIELRVPASIAYEIVHSQDSSWQFWRRKRNP
jgi:signal transduction histidine kinase/ligand-binding sensor domain-containing protein